MKSKITRKQATLYSLALCTGIFIVTTLAPAVNDNFRQPTAMATEIPQVPEDTQVQVSTIPPIGATLVKKETGSTVGAFLARGVFTAPADIRFKSSLNKNIAYYQWSFGDPNSPAEKNTVSGGLPSSFHTYAKPGTYKATLKGYATIQDYRNGIPADVRELDIVVKKQAVSATGWIWPTDGRFVRGVRYGHQGLDISNRLGTPVVAARQGVVVKTNTAGWGGGYGKYVVLKHSDGLYSIYAHFSRVSVVKGQQVQAGELLGGMGSTGRSTAVHLHFGIGRTMMVNSNVLNPLNLLPRR